MTKGSEGPAVGSTESGLCPVRCSHATAGACAFCYEALSAQLVRAEDEVERLRKELADWEGWAEDDF